MKLNESAETKADHQADVVIVGAGIAGLTAAWDLRRRDVVVLESAPAVGGRIRSTRIGGIPVNLGAHMVPGPGSTVGGLVAELGLATAPLPRRLFGIGAGNRLLLDTPDVLLPFVLELGWRDRIAFARMGAILRFYARRASVAGRRRPGETPEAHIQRQLAFEDERTLANLIGPLPERTARILTALTERNGTDPDIMSAGHGLRSFANVWAKTAPGTNLVGGTGALPAALADRLGDRVRPNHTVTRVEALSGSGVRVRYDGPAGPGTIHAKASILATPAPITRQIAPDLPPTLTGALEQIRSGDFLSLGIALSEGPPLPWQDVYAVAAPGRRFSVLFNHDAMRDPTTRDGTHAMMLFAGASNAAHTMTAGDAEIEGAWIADLDHLCPGIARRIAGTALGRWPGGAPYSYPGRARLQPVLEQSAGPIALAGDYMEFPNMEAAANSGRRAAASIARSF